MKMPNPAHLNENAKVLLIASAFLAIVMFATYLQWFS